MPGPVLRHEAAEEHVESGEEQHTDEPLLMKLSLTSSEAAFQLLWALKYIRMTVSNRGGVGEVPKTCA